MNSRTVSALWAALVMGIATGGAAEAHHSFSMFDVTKSRMLAGTVRAFEFNYPHSWIWIDVPNGKGGAEPWGFEGAGPAELNRAGGWTRTTLKAGDKISVQFCPLRSGQHGGAFSRVTLPGGRTMAGASNLCVLRHQGPPPR